MDGKINEAEFGCASKAPFKKLDVDGGKNSQQSCTCTVLCVCVYWY